MDAVKQDQVRAVVRDQYGKVAREAVKASAPSCCGGSAASASLAFGYSESDIADAPDGANLGLGCGNPQAIAALSPGEVVLDLGSGGGFDCFLAARVVGETGRVIGVDMTPDMISRARENASTHGAKNVEFRLGEIEHLPVADGVVDVILSNCVINLSPNKSEVFKEAFRVLKPGGRLAISDVVAIRPMPEALRANAAALVGCVAGAVEVPLLRELLVGAGFECVSVEVDLESHKFIGEWIPGENVQEYVSSAKIEAVKPSGKPRACCGPAAKG